MAGNLFLKISYMFESPSLDVGPALYKCYTNILCSLGRGHYQGDLSIRLRNISPDEIRFLAESSHFLSLARPPLSTNICWRHIPINVSVKTQMSFVPKTLYCRSIMESLRDDSMDLFHENVLTRHHNYVACKCNRSLSIHHHMTHKHYINFI